MNAALIRAYQRSHRLQHFYRSHLARFFNPWIKSPPYSSTCRRLIDRSGDPVRYSAIAMALARIDSDKIPGAIAELGVYRGDLSEFLSKMSPDRTLYLFDTFQGFPAQDRNGHAQRFTDTSVDQVRRRVNSHAIFRVGCFPETSIGLEGEQFALASLDADLYNPMRAGFEFFWARLSPGGYIFAHDFHSCYPVAEAVRDAGITGFVELPDKYSSIIIRKPQG